LVRLLVGHLTRLVARLVAKVTGKISPVAVVLDDELSARELVLEGVSDRKQRT